MLYCVDEARGAPWMEAFGFRGRLDWTGETIERGVDAAMDIATKKRPGAHEPNPSQKSIASLCLSLARAGGANTHTYTYTNSSRGTRGGCTVVHSFLSFSLTTSLFMSYLSP
jgi:hypothetical protein